MLRKKRNWIIDDAQLNHKGRKSRKKKKDSKEKSVTNIKDINTTISITAVNVSCSSAPVKKQRLSEWVTNYAICKKPNLKTKTARLKVNGGICVSFNCGFLKIYAQWWDCWVLVLVFNAISSCSP